MRDSVFTQALAGIYLERPGREGNPAVILFRIVKVLLLDFL